MTSCITLSILRRIATFLTKLQHKDAYVVSQLPTPMHRDVVLPSCLDCSRIHTRLLEADLWASEGHTRSVLHKDADNVRIQCDFLFFFSLFPSFRLLSLSSGLRLMGSAPSPSSLPTLENGAPQHPSSFNAALCTFRFMLTCAFPVTHDTSKALNCLVAGEKKWIFVDPKQIAAGNVPMVWEPDDEIGGWVDLAVWQCTQTCHGNCKFSFQQTSPSSPPPFFLYVYTPCSLVNAR